MPLLISALVLAVANKMIAILERLGWVYRWEVNAKIKGQTPASTDLGNTSLWPPKWPRENRLEYSLDDRGYNFSKCHGSASSDP
jgi:hypothetical protein